MNYVILPHWFENVAVAGMALAPLTTAIVQLLKVLLARLGMPEGYSGYITIIVSVIMVAVAISANVLQIETKVAEVVQVAQTIVNAMATIAGALGWYKLAKSANVARPVTWKE